MVVHTSRPDPGKYLLPMARRTNLVMRPEDYYEIKQGVAGYAPIIGTIGALAVPAIIVLFTARVPPGHRVLVTLAASLLIVGMLGSLTSAFVMAAIGAASADCQSSTGNDVRSGSRRGIYRGRPIGIRGPGSYLPARVKLTLRRNSCVGGLAGVVFTAFGVGDSWNSGPAALSELAGGFALSGV